MDLGPGARALQVACGNWHTCALLEGGGVKCWGMGMFGMLGSGSASDIGAGLGEMGEQLPFVDLGSSARALQVTAGRFHSCAVLEDGRAKCWGWNINGQLGLGDTQQRGHQGGQLGDELPAIDLGASFVVAQLTAGILHNCALSQEGQVKCWGDGGSGQLGQGDNSNIGRSPESMGEALPAIRLGARVTQIASAGNFNCALLEDGSLKCWGENFFGQLGQGNVDAFLEPVAVELGQGLRAVHLATSGYHSCAIFQDDSLKCWGGAESGQLGNGDTANIIVGDEAGEMEELERLDLGALRVRQVVAGYAHTCVLLSDDSARCFGMGSYGGLGTGSPEPVVSSSWAVPADLFSPTPRNEWGGLRLRPSGILEVRHGNMWGLICDDGWDDLAAQAGGCLGVRDNRV